MASMTAALRDRLKADAGVNAIAATRVYRDERPQGSGLPAIVIMLVSDPRDYTYAGRTDFRRSRVTVECLASSRGAADEMAEAVIAACEGAAVVGATTFQRVIVANQFGDSDRVTDGTIFRAAVDLFVWHSTPDGTPGLANTTTQGD